MPLHIRDYEPVANITRINLILYKPIKNMIAHNFSQAYTYNDQVVIN